MLVASVFALLGHMLYTSLAFWTWAPFCFLLSQVLYQRRSRAYLDALESFRIDEGFTALVRSLCRLALSHYETQSLFDSKPLLGFEI